MAHTYRVVTRGVTISKQLAWQEEERQCRRWRDALGKPIDPGILDTVVLLRLLGLETTSSCEGHLDRATDGPYVVFRAPGMNDVEREARAIGDVRDREFKRLQQVARRANREARDVVVRWLSSFYKGRTTPFDDRLIIGSQGFEAGRLQTHGGTAVEFLEPRARMARLRAAQNEMRAFTEYVRHRAGYF